jgi:Sulfatase-modifying factor enzyme 1
LRLENLKTFFKNMKYLFIPTFFLFTIGLNVNAVTAQELPKPPLPIGTFQISDSVYMDDTEIANIHWLEFLHDVEIDSGKAFWQKMLPDTTVWKNIDPDDVLFHHYFRFPEFQYRPIIGISYEQAKAYCLWRSNIVNDDISKKIKKGNKGYKHLKGYRMTVTYRLPTEDEWELAAAGGLALNQYPYGKTAIHGNPIYNNNRVMDESDYFYLMNKLDTIIHKNQLILDIKAYRKSHHELNIICFRDYPYFFTILDKITRRVSEGKPNGFKLHHMVGNAAEMVEEKGIAKGGSWVHSVEQCAIKNRLTYSEPTMWLGFRCAAEVRLEKIDPNVE